MTDDEHERAAAERRAQREGDAIDNIADVLSGRTAAREARRRALEHKALVESRWPRDIHGEVIRPGTMGDIRSADFIAAECRFLAMRGGVLRVPEGDETPCAEVVSGAALPFDVVRVFFRGGE